MAEEIERQESQDSLKLYGDASLVPISFAAGDVLTMRDEGSNSVIQLNSIVLSCHTHGGFVRALLFVATRV